MKKIVKKSCKHFLDKEFNTCISLFNCFFICRYTYNFQFLKKLVKKNCKSTNNFKKLIKLTVPTVFTIFINSRSNELLLAIYFENLLIFE